MALAIYIDNDWPIAIVIGIVIDIVIDIVDMSTATCHCNLSIIIIMVLILFVSNYFNSVTQSESVSDSV